MAENTVECRYRGRVIGWLAPAEDGFLRYFGRSNGWKSIFDDEWIVRIPHGIIRRVGS
jgi:hypothetical protein